MKLIILSVLHHVLFYGVLLVSPPQAVRFDKASECDFINSEKTALPKNATTVSNNKTDLLVSEILFKY